MHCLSVMPRAGCILPLRVVMTVRWVSARLVVAPYGADWECVILFDKFMFDLLRAGYGFLIAPFLGNCVEICVVYIILLC